MGCSSGSGSAHDTSRGNIDAIMNMCGIFLANWCIFCFFIGILPLLFGRVHDLIARGQEKMPLRFTVTLPLGTLAMESVSTGERLHNENAIFLAACDRLPEELAQSPGNAGFVEKL